jgi:antitoxin (DNA-binding transcriptional repressor) of toxin-antitoxin stability system
MTEAEVSGNFADVLKKIGRGEEVVVDRNGQAVAIIKPVPREARTLSELVALARQREQDRGYAITLDEDYAADVEQIVRDRKAWIPHSWE